MKQTDRQRTGILIVLMCGCMWGLGGVMGQLLFQRSDISVAALCSLRMTLTGILILIVTAIRRDRQLFTVWKEKHTICTLLAFSCLGVLTVQYTYFAAIAESNAATATVLQYTYPILILLYTSVISRKMPSAYEAAAICIAFTGIFLIATHGKPQTLSISKTALFWGLLSAAAFVCYTIMPQKLYKKAGLANVSFSFMDLAGFGCILGAIWVAAIRTIK